MADTNSSTAAPASPESQPYPPHCPCPNSPPTWGDQAAFLAGRAMSDSVDQNKFTNQIGNMVLSHAQQNSELLGRMFSVRGAQTNPIEASSIAALTRGGAAADSAQAQDRTMSSAALMSAVNDLKSTQAAVLGQLNALAMAVMNLANVTPSSKAA